MEAVSRKEREKNRHREEIMHNALDLFSEKGFHNVSMQDIAARSEFAVGTLYKFFVSKEQLFGELRNDCAERILQTLMPVLESDKTEDEKIRQFISSHINMAEENLKFIKLYVSEHGTLTVSNDEADGKAYAVKAILQNKLCDIVDAGVAKKMFRPIDSEIYVQSLIAALQAHIMESSKNYDRARVQNGLGQIEKLFCDILNN